MSKVYIPTAIYRFVESPGSLAVIYGGRLSLARLHLHRYNPGERNIFRFRGSRRSVSPRRGGRIRTKIGTKLILREVADRERWCREMERNIYIYNDRVKENFSQSLRRKREKERERTTRIVRLQCDVQLAEDYYLSKWQRGKNTEREREKK